MTAAMLRSVLRRSAAASSYASSRGFNSASTQERKVAILGAAGGIGQPLSLLMKLNPMVSSLALYDIAGTPGVAADVSHINTRSEVLFLFYPFLVVSMLILGFSFAFSIVKAFNFVV